MRHLLGKIFTCLAHPFARAGMASMIFVWAAMELNPGEELSQTVVTGYRLLIGLGFFLFAADFFVDVLKHGAECDVSRFTSRLFFVFVGAMLLVLLAKANAEYLGMLFFVVGALLLASGGLHVKVIDRGHEGGGKALGVAALQREMKDVDYRVAAVHEAGHALLHASMSPLPSNFQIVIGRNDSSRGSLGYVSGVYEDRLVQTKRFAEWQMVMMLAGSAAELALLNVQSLGRSSDYGRWLMSAKTYLENGFYSAYFSSPETTDQRRMNAEAIDALKSNHESILAEFFRVNRQVLIELADRLESVRAMNAEELDSYLLKVRPVDGLPVPLVNDREIAT